MIKRWAIVGLCGVLAGCSSLSPSKLFSHYSQQNHAVRGALVKGDYQQALNNVPTDSGDPLLEHMERGRLALLSHEYTTSHNAFLAGYQEVQQLEDKAVISASGTLSNIGALALNDNVTDYLPAEYELGYLHLYQSYNYLRQNNLEGALVEMRRANKVQERALANSKSSLVSAEEKMQQQGVRSNLGSVLSRYPDAGNALQAIQNGYLLFVSALLYEAEGNLNSAYIDAKRALAVNPGNHQVIDAVRRLANKLNDSQTLSELQKRYGNKGTARGNVVSEKGQVIVLVEEGVVSAMQEWQVKLPAFDSRGQGAIYSVALPYYPPTPPVNSAKVMLGSSPLKLQPLNDVNLMAQQELTNNMPTILTRQLLRVVAKDQVRKEVAGDDALVNLLLNVANTLTEKADTRSWQSLPATVKSADAMLNVGGQRISIGEHYLDFDVKAGTTTLIWISHQGDNAAMWSLNLGKI